MKSLVWVELFVLVFMITLIFVPRPKIVRLLPLGVIAGMGLAIIYTYSFVNIFNVWQFNYLNFFSYAGIPLFLTAIWIPMVIIYAHFLSFMDTRIGVYSLIALFAVIGTTSQYVLILWGFLEFYNWSLMATFLLSLFTHAGLAYYLFVSGILSDLKQWGFARE